MSVSNKLYQMKKRLQAVDRRELLLNLLMIAVSISIVIAGAEVGVRLSEADPSPIDKHRFCNSPKDHMKFHPTYGWIEHSNHQYLEHQPGDVWEYHEHNKNGFRDTYDNGKEDIVVLGDSFTQGHLASNNETFPYLLDKTNPQTAFHNYGVASYGTSQELLVYQNIKQRFEHKLVILGYYAGNDMSDNIRKSPERPQFELQNDTLVQTHKPERNPPETSRDGIDYFVNHPKFNEFQGWLDRHSKAYRLFWPRLRMLKGRLIDNRSYGLQSAPDGQKLERQTTLTKALLNQVAAATGNGTEMLLLYIPSRTEVNPDNPMKYSPESADQYWNVQKKMLSSVAKNNSDVYMLDPTATLRQASQAEGRVYGKRDPHLQDEGYRVLAQTTQDWLSTNGYVKQSNAIQIEADSDEDKDRTCPR